MVKSSPSNGSSGTETDSSLVSGATSSSCAGTRGGFVLVFTRQLQVTVVDRHVPRNLHVAPGALGVVVRVTALVAGQTDLGDELLVLAEPHHLWQ